MQLRIVVMAALVAAVLAFAPAGAAASPTCSAKKCVERLTASERVKTFRVEGAPGEGWLLYLNIYVGKERLLYERLAGACDASYFSARVSAVLHACGKRRSVLEYVSFAERLPIRVEYRYARR